MMILLKILGMIGIVLVGIITIITIIVVVIACRYEDPYDDDDLIWWDDHDENWGDR